MLSYSLIEQTNLSQCRSKTARRGLLSTYKQLHWGIFGDKEEFRLQLQAAMKALLLEEPTVQKVLIISAHGEPMTGTLIEAGRAPDGQADLIDMWGFNDHFKVSPPNLTIFLSCCWGGYAEIARAIQYNASPCPVVVGPLVNVQFKHIAQIQVDLLKAIADVPSELQASPSRYGDLSRIRVALAPLLKKYNSKQFRSAYHQRDLLGMHFRPRDFHPRRAVGVLACPVQKVMTTLVGLRDGEGTSVWPVYEEEDGRILVGTARHSDDFAGHLGVIGGKYRLWIQLISTDIATEECAVNIIGTKSHRRDHR